MATRALAFVAWSIHLLCWLLLGLIALGGEITVLGALYAARSMGG